MDLTSIEATSVAIRAGQVAAAELTNLLTHEDEDLPTPIEDWFDPRGFHEQPPTHEGIEELALKVEKLGGYVCHSPDPVSGERLYRWAVYEDLVRRAEWIDLPWERRQAYELFAGTVRAVYVPLKAEQERLIAIGTEPPRQLGLALEDSIFEPEEGLGALRKESIAAAPLIANYQRETAAAAAAEAERKADEDPADAGRVLSIGEAPVKPPVNRGGRGNRKSG
jgi:hypothetical protein